MEVVVTEAVASGSNQTVDKGIVRVVKVEDNGTIDYSTVVEDGRPALNPHLRCRRLEDGSCELIPYSFSTREVEYRWELSDGHVTHWSPLSADEKDRMLIHDFSQQQNAPRVTLMMRDRADPTFTEEISQEI